MKRTRIKSVLAMLVLISMAFSLSVMPVWAEPEELAPIAVTEETTEKLSESAEIKSAIDYYEYRAQYAQVPAPVGVLATVRPADMTIMAEEGGMTIEPSFAGKDNVLVWNSAKAEVSFTVNVPADARYQMNMTYSPIASANNQATVEMAMTIDGHYPFASASRFQFQKPYWVEQEWEKDSRGNDMRPAQERVDGEWFTSPFEDSEGEYNEAYSFYLTAGVHTITLKADKVGFALSEISVLNPEPLKAYEDYRAALGEGAVATQSVTLQAETMAMTSDAMITANYDRSSAATQPSDYKLMLLNSMGGSKWLYAGQWAEWEFEVPEDGFYNIHMRGRQNLKSGMFVTRRIEIDGVVPFAELNAVRFPFSSSWYTKTLGDETPYEFYLTKGTHKIRMTIVPGALEDTIQQLQDSVQILNESYRKILMITGPVPDTYRDYNLQKTVPGLMDTFKEQSEVLKREKQILEEITGTTGSESSILETLYLQLDGFIDDPRSIQDRLSRYKSNISSLASWLLTIREQPLELDYFSFQPAGETAPKANVAWYKSLAYEIMSVVASFSENFATVGDYHEDGESLNVWVNMGRDQIQLVKELVDADFVAKHPGIKVNVNLVQTGLVEATLAGKGPDISLFVALAEPVNLAARGALVDLASFPDYEEVAERFYDSASVPYHYEGGIYALPATQTFPMMFYRTDIFEELEIEPPETWDDLYEIAPIIQRQNLEIGVPSGTNASGAATDMGMFPTLVFQNGGRYYNEELTATELDQEPALQAFTEWTQLYTRYGFPVQFDLYNRFRTGEMPLGIAAYTQYNMLSAAAPEIKGLWEMVPIPGTYVKDENGNQVYDENGEPVINRTANGYGSQGCVILNNCKDKDAAWTFLKWFTSAEVQEKFGNQIEALMGPSARYATANKEAFEGLPWTTAEKDILKEQWQYVREVEEIPASYYITRNVANAFRNVTNNYANPRHTLNTYNMEMNKEITRKRQEFGLPVDLEIEEE